MLEEHGLDGLTLRAVARQAGVTPTVLYTYFDDMAALRNRLADDFLARLDLSLLRAQEPHAALGTFLHHVLRAFTDAPGHVAILATQRIAGVGALALNEALLDFFEDAAGLGPREASRATWLLTEWVHGRVLLARSDSGWRGFEAAMGRLDLDAYPRTAAMDADPGDDWGVMTLVHALVPDG